MAFIDFFIDWFVIIFTTTFLLTAIIVQIRQMGHLKLGRDMKKGELIGILILLGFNILIFLPFMLIFLILDYGAELPPVFELLALVILFLRYLIPTIIGGTLAYFILEGIYSKWGTHIVSLFITVIVTTLFFLDSINLLAPSLPYFFETAIDFISTGFSYLIFLLLIGLCLGRSKRETLGDEPPKRPNPMPSISSSSDNSLRLLVGLGRRIVIDDDVCAYQSLKGILQKEPAQQRLIQAATRIEMPLESMTSKDDIIYAQQVLGSVMGQFGKLTKTIGYAFYLFIVIGFVSAFLTPMLFFQGLTAAIFLIMPAIMFPVIAVLGYQETAKYEVGRIRKPTVSQYNSYLLTNGEFARRSLIAKLLTTISSATLIIIIGTQLLAVPFVNLTWIIIPSIVLLVTAYLSSKDRMILGARLETDTIIDRGLIFIGTSVETESKEFPDPTQESDEGEFKELTPEISDSWEQELEMRGQSEFVKKVKSSSREIYKEHTVTLYYLGAGGMLLFTGIFTFLLFSDTAVGSSFMLLFPIGLLVVGAPLFVYGTFTYLKLRKYTRFYGLTRKQITIFLSEMDFREYRIDHVGAITDIHSPSEYVIFGAFSGFIMSTVRAAFVKIQDNMKWPKSIVEEIKKSRTSGPKLEVLATLGSSIGFIILFLWFDSFDLIIFGGWMESLFLLLVGSIVLSGVFSIAMYYSEKNKILMFWNRLNQADDISFRESVLSFLELFNNEFHLPLRVLLIGDYPGIDYTGKTYYTTSGLELNEAVIIPRV